ncbi:MAG: flagellin lysine-N-methylase [Clostridia bacterium]|nr:flagellin lysine-N-methylase [Clostridia bacterium]
MEDHTARSCVHDIFVPDYFLKFACKMGACRSACCQGWPVTVSQDNYFHLLGVSCSDELRRRLDCGMYLLDSPYPDAYACFGHRYDGNCSLRLPDGRCAIHAELGEEHLADVCRLYPRGVRRSDCGDECSCANSCEAVLELFWGREEPISFSRQSVSLILPKLPDINHDLPPRAQRMTLIQEMQQTHLTLPERIEQVGRSLGLSVSPSPEAGRLARAVAAAYRMIVSLADRSESLHVIDLQKLEHFADAASAEHRYLEAKTDFAQHFPHWETFFTHVLVNHMFFSQFPASIRKMDAAYTSLCLTYALLRFLAVGCTDHSASDASLIDLCAAFFRVVEHTDFTALSMQLLRSIPDAAAGDLLVL